MENMETIYYAHSKLIYGSKREETEIELLRKNFRVIDPNSDMGELGGIEPYLNMVSKCNKVVCSEYEGYVGRGVASEVIFALDNKIPVMCLRKKKLLKVKTVKIIDIDWKIRYAELQCGGNGDIGR